MKAVIYHSYNNIRLENRPVPSILDTELLVRVHGCGLCGSDIIKITHQAPPPVVLGHELTGTIVERGKAVSNVEVGQRVIVAHHVPCGECHYCRHQNYSMCAAFKASNIDPCGFAEYIRVPAQHVQHTTLPLPDSLSAEEGSFVEPLACCVRAVRRTPLLSGDCVVVMGLGSIGLLMIQVLKALDAGGFERRIKQGSKGTQPLGGVWGVPTFPSFPGMGRGKEELTTSSALGAGNAGNLHVYGVDLLPERLQLARSLGADDAFLAPADDQGLREELDPHTAGRGADAVIITAPGVRPFMQALAGLRKGGTINIFAAHTGTVPINLETIYQQELSITSTYSSSPAELHIALDLLSRRKVRVDGLISHRLPLSQFSEGVMLMRERAALKVYFQISGEQ
ncbi:MAG TPA: alcohol dehydrogenase catalytic domain-containing protein [Ktedonobacteraceae bacterium]